MRLWPLAIAACGAAMGFWRGPSDVQVLILSGDTNGNLAPCGCTKPMSGGIKRRVRAAKQLSLSGHTTLLDNGNLVAGTGRQDQLKAQTMAEALGAAGWNAINVGPADARLGLGLLLSLHSLSQNKFVSSALRSSEVNQYVVSGPFMVLALSSSPQQVAAPLGQRTRSVAETLQDLVGQSEQADLAPILLLQGSQEEARSLATQFPALRLVQYRGAGIAPAEPEFVGNTLLVTPGSDGKNILRLEYADGKFRGYSVVNLGPQFEDDPQAARQYKSYLNRVSEERLLENLARTQTVAYAGTQSCGSCHSKTLAQWSHTEHAHALKTLDREGHARDPECLPCHVVGLQSTKGFVSRKETPRLANVGCESCHGSSVAHSKNPWKIHLPKVGESTCQSCHTVNTSPGFNFQTYWARIKH